MKRPFNFQEILSIESAYVDQAPADFGDFNTHAEVMAAWNFDFVKHAKRSHSLVSFPLVAMRKLSLLSYLSVVRRHEMQAYMTMRQYLEFAAIAAYLSAHRDEDVPQAKLLELKALAYRWFENYPQLSQILEAPKQLINSSMAHARISQAARLTDLGLVSTGNVRGFFFDQASEVHSKMNLFVVGLISLTAIDVISTMAEMTNSLVMNDDFAEVMSSQHTLSDKLFAQLRVMPEVADVVQN